MHHPSSPTIDRGDPSPWNEKTEEMVTGNDPDDSGTASAVSVTKPRVGGATGNVPWTGGSNLKNNEEAANILCFRPSHFKEMQRQHETLKRGLDESQRMDFVDATKTTVGLTMWITWMQMALVQKGMDTVLMMLTEPGKELNLMTN